MALPATRPEIAALLARACEELEHRLAAGHQSPAAELLGEIPDLAADRDTALELIYTEFVLREERGEHPTPDEWCARFPEWEADLRAVFQVNAHLRAEVGAADRTLDWAGDRTKRIHPGPETTGRQAGDYLIEAELGRGGMGVVYRARQRSLNRTVALKMILGGEFADPRHVARFRREAEAVARLQHPNIVQVYEIGEWQPAAREEGWAGAGTPFFTMEYVEGGTLARRLATAPPTPAEAAALVEELARAVSYAHRRGLVHRDLKPANVLLQPTPADPQATGAAAQPAPLGTPKITDFGLAKLLAGDDSSTVTGAVLGTPGYMAPEQAAGDTKRVGPGADVYALGAILYECLGGRPPFDGGSHWAVLRQVQDATPLPPSRLRPRVPKDLETICLKCLEKDPARRYPSALALAEDLHRFQHDEPIRARPPSALYQFRKFARRNTAAVLAVAAVFLALVVGLIGTWVGLARADAARERAERAERDARARLAESYARAAELAVQRGAWRTALESLDRALEAGHPDAVRLRLQKVRAWCAIHEVAKALVELAELSGRPDLGDLEGSVRLWQGDIALARKVDDFGLELVRGALRRGLPPADESYARGLLAPTVPEAVSHFRAALDRDTFHHRANEMVVVLLVIQGEMAEARERAALARRLFPEDPTFSVLLAVVHAWEGDAAAAERELERARPQLGAEQFAAMRGLTEIAREVRLLERPLSEMIQDPARLLSVVSFATRSGKALRAVEAAQGELLLPVPPAFATALQRVASVIAAGPGRMIEELRQATAAHPDGLLLFMLGIHLANADRFPEAEEAFRAASDRPSFIPVRRPALYALSFCQWQVAAGAADQAAGREAMDRSVESARRLLGYGRLTRHEAVLVAAVAYAAGEDTLVRSVTEAQERLGEGQDLTLLKYRMKVEFRTRAYHAAVAVADRILVVAPNDQTARAYRAEALRRLGQNPR
jgi:serine/threonine protein kinase/tetratricopeptide (TPR) repeat protein